MRGHKDEPGADQRMSLVREHKGQSGSAQGRTVLRELKGEPGSAQGRAVLRGEPVLDPELVARIYETVVRQDTCYDGIYYTGVHTTGIFCRPSCRARTPLLKNISFYASMEKALEAGFRPCKRCKPEAPGPAAPEARLVQDARRAMEEALPKAIPLEELAGRLHISPYYLQRVFKQHAGVSPAEYTAARRLETASAMLTGTSLPVAEISSRAGFSSPAYFAAFFHRRTGLSPSDYRLQAEASKTLCCRKAFPSDIIE